MSKSVSKKKRSATRAKRGSSATAHRNGSSEVAAGNGAGGSLDLEQLLPESKLYYRIGEVSAITGVKAYVLRYWESEFRWMSPQKSRSKQRLYRRKDIETILLIRKLLYEERYTIAGARQRLRELGAGKASGTSAAKRAAEAAGSAAPAGSATSGKTVDAASLVTSDKSAAFVTDTRAKFRQIKEELIAIRASL